MDGRDTARTHLTPCCTAVCAEAEATCGEERHGIMRLGLMPSNQEIRLVLALGAGGAGTQVSLHPVRQGSLPFLGCMR